MFAQNRTRKACGCAALCVGALAHGEAAASECATTDPVALVATPYVSHWDAYDALACLEESLIAHGDRRAIFASVYTLTTLRMAEAIDSETFEDTNWMRAYQTAFANDYREAFLAYEQEQYAAVPSAWLLAFDATLAGETLIIQDVLLGMNAHINYDLPFAVESVGVSPNTARKRRDHTRVNDVLAEVTDELVASLQSLYGANYVALDAALGPLDELLVAANMALARENAWNNAVALSASQWWNRWLIEGWIDAGAVGSAELVLSVGLDPGLFQTLAALEGSSAGSTFCQHFPCSVPGN